MKFVFGLSLLVGSFLLTQDALAEGYANVPWTFDAVITNKLDHDVHFTYSHTFSSKPTSYTLTPGQILRFQHPRDFFTPGNPFISYQPKRELDVNPVDRVLGNKREYEFRKDSLGISVFDVGDVTYSIHFENKTEKTVKFFVRHCQTNNWTEEEVSAGQTQTITFDPSYNCNAPEVRFYPGKNVFTAKTYSVKFNKRFRFVGDANGLSGLEAMEDGSAS